MSDAPIRPASVADADTIAALHAASWRSAYRGILSERTLGPALDGERRTHWRGKLAKATPQDTVLIAGDMLHCRLGRWRSGLRSLSRQSAYLS